MVDKRITLGGSIQIKGDLTGNEDVMIDGDLEGSIRLEDHNLTIGTNGKIKAEVQAKAVVVVGEVVGNITADDKVEIAPSGSVEGDIRAPRVSIADGAKFKGSIDMDRKGVASSASKGAGASTSTTVPPSKTGGVVSTPSPAIPRSASATKG